MQPEDSALPPPIRIGREMLIPALVCAAISALLMQAFFLALLFLLPLGLCAVVFGPRAAWLGTVFAIAGNVVLALMPALRSGVGMAQFGVGILYYTVLAAGFTWIMAGNPQISGVSIPPVRTLFRFIAAAVAGTLVLFAQVLYVLGGDNGFSGFIRGQIEAYIAQFGADPSQQAYIEQLLGSDNIIEQFSMIIFRGGALVSVFFLLFFSRQLAFLFARLFRRNGGSLFGDLGGFHAPREVILISALCLPVVLLCRIVSLDFLAVVAWNILVVCAIMFFAQGSGIVLFQLIRRPMPMIMRLFFCLLLVILILSPGINELVLGIVVLLGIAEQWLPLRVLKQNREGT